MQVHAYEYSLTLSRASLAAGRDVVEFDNLGQDPHDLHVRPAAGGADVFAFPTSPSGEIATGALNLAPGRYTFYCALPGHEALGMSATLTVT